MEEVPGAEVWVIGYFHRHNLGDDVFAWLFEHILPEMFPGLHVAIINSDSVPLLMPPPQHVRAIIVGGGDLINDYFHRKIKCILEVPANRTCPVYAIGVGIPYPKLIGDGYLDLYDFIVHRSSDDHLALVDRYGHDQVVLVPDLAWLMRTVPVEPSTMLSPWTFKPTWFKRKPNVKKVGVFLARPMRGGNQTAYEKVVNGVATFLFALATERRISKKCGARKQKPRFLIELVPFQTGPDVADHENDALMNQDVMHKLMELSEGKPLDNVAIVNQSPSVQDALSLFRAYDFTVCSRFHAHIFSFMAGVPVVSVSCSRKVQVLMRDAKLERYLYQLPVDDKGRPVHCDANVISVLFEMMVQNECELRTHLKAYGDRCESRVRDFKVLLGTLLFHLPKPVTRFIQGRVADKVSSFLAANLTAENRLRVDSEGVVSCEDAVLDETYKQEGAIAALNLNDHDLDRVVRLISWLLVGKPVSEYSWGTRENICKPMFRLSDACNWVFNHRLLESDAHRFAEFPAWKRKPMSHLAPAVNVEFVRPALECRGVHRSGWDYVMEEVVKFHDPKANVIFDGYLDETFGWRYEVLRDAGVIPFRRPWKGVLHHTPDQTCSDNNLVRLFSRKAWRDSLAMCEGLLTLSENLAVWVRRRLQLLHLPNVRVSSILHPTEFVTKVNKFSWRDYNSCTQRRVIQVGGWLRNTYAIYDFPLWIARYGYSKLALQGHIMEHYYLTDEQFEQFMLRLQQAWDTHVIGGLPGGDGNHCQITGSEADVEVVGFEATPSSLVERGKVGDNVGYKALTRNPAHVSPWIIGARESSLVEMRKKRASVTVLSHVDNDGYDKLLRECVVFINLVDCSAVNTIVECIVRNTPILVNPLPAVVEYLGPHYPLYYSDLEHAARLLTSEVAVYEAHMYLKSLDKSKLRIEHFSSSFSEFLTQ